jgi:hypothetical protein
VLFGEAPVTAGPGDEKAAAAVGHGHLRASHADREHVIDTLKAAFVQGRLTKDELDLRVGQTFAARTYADLAAVTADFPAGLTAAQPLRKPARRPMNNAAKAGMCGSIAAATLVVLTLVGGPAAFFMCVIFYFMGLLVAGAQMLDSRHNRRSGGQLPPRSAQGSQVLEGEHDGTIGDDLILSEVRNDARARHLPGHMAIQRACRPLTARRGQRRPPSLQVTA